METRKINIWNQEVDAIATFHSTYIMNQSDPLTAVAVRAGTVVKGWSKEEGNLLSFDGFDVLLFRSLVFDQERFDQWIELIKEAINEK